MTEHPLTPDPSKIKTGDDEHLGPPAQPPAGDVEESAPAGAAAAGERPVDLDEADELSEAERRRLERRYGLVIVGSAFALLTGALVLYPIVTAAFPPLDGPPGWIFLIVFAGALVDFAVRLFCRSPLSVVGLTILAIGAATALAAGIVEALAHVLS